MRLWAGQAALVIVLVSGYQAWQKRDVVKGRAPPIQAAMADGVVFSSETWRAAHPGRSVLLHFWAEWCPICRAEESSITSLTRDWPVMTIAMQSGMAGDVRRHLENRGLDWPVVVDTDGGIARTYGLRAVPAFIVIDRQGRIRFTELGYTTEAGMRLRLWWSEQFQ